MFEGLVQRVLVGYLGRYVKDIHKDQLKLSLWNEEVFLENVELIPEAFDYLRLPFAVKQGRVGRLSIKISWKKLGWDYPIIIFLEDVFIRASQRADQEWNMDAVERREFAGKKAQLAAAELAKLSRRVCDNKAGKSFISYITAKVLDSIQVSIRNFHVQYSDMQPDSVLVLFGLKFSSLTIKQNPVGLSGGKMMGSQVNKSVNIEGLEIYCSTFEGDIDMTSLDDASYSKFWCSERSEDSKLGHLLHPFDVSVSLVVNRAGKLDGESPQYLFKADITGLAMSLDEVQLQQILILLDYLSTSHLREKYGRYRPWGSPLSRKEDGWQKLWWHYAQESILSDVRRKLKKTSWRYLGLRLSYRRKYIKLYSTKLYSLQQDQSIDEFVLRELEQMERESDIDEILSYRSAAESQLQEVLSNSFSDVGVDGANKSMEKSQSEEHLSGKSRGWLNWLSRGMLGAGGTDDSSQFSGVVSDEVVQDIYEATKFHPLDTSGGDADTDDKIFACAIKFSIGQISATLQIRNSAKIIADLNFKDAVIECKLWEELTTLICFIRSIEMVYPTKEKVILQMGGSLLGKSSQENDQRSCRIQVDLLPKGEIESLVEIMLPALEVTCDMDFFQNFVEFLIVLTSFKFQHERVLLSLNGIEDVKTRLVSKAEYILSSRRKQNWNVGFSNIMVNVPWRNSVSEQCSLVLELGSLLCTSKRDICFVASSTEDQSYVLKQFSSSTPFSDFLPGFQVKDLYDYFDVILEDFELKVVLTQYDQTMSILEKFRASITMASCIISEESTLKQLEVYIVLSSLNAHFSPFIYESVVGWITYIDTFHPRFESLILRKPNLISLKSDHPWVSSFGFLLTADLELVNVHVDLANDGENMSKLVLFLRESHIRYSHTESDECWVCTKALKVTTCPMRGENDGHILFSSLDQFASKSAHNQQLGVGWSNEDGNIFSEGARSEACFLLHYEASRSTDILFHKCTIGLNGTDLHCYPYIVGLLIGFYNQISSCSASVAHDNSFIPVDAKNLRQMPGFEFQRFGYSNFLETWHSDQASICLDCFPFITIRNSGSLGNLENSLCYPISEWRKLYRLMDQKLRSPHIGLKAGHRNFHSPKLTCKYGMPTSTAPESSHRTNILNIDINLCNVKVHFHDSSCIIGTVTIPSSESSLLFDEGCMDLLCSIEGLMLTSSGWMKNFHNFLWGPSFSNLSPILNIRVKKGNNRSLASPVEVSFGIQHVCCVLSPEYLAILIGYFSLPDWSSNSSEQSVMGHCEYTYSVNEGNIVYKFEILDSTLIFPVEQDGHRFLKLEVQQLYCSYIHNYAQDDVLIDIPPELMLTAPKIAKANHCLNMFGRDLYLSLLLCEHDENDCLVLDQDTSCISRTLLVLLSADLWIRIPCEGESCIESSSVSTCIMSRIGQCQLVADDCYTFSGYESLLDVINQFSLVDNESKLFTSDVLHFLQLKRSLKENDAVSLVASSNDFTEVHFSVDLLSVRLYDTREQAIYSEPMAKVDLRFVCFASLMNDSLIGLDASFSSVVLYSLRNSVMLAQCSDTSSTSALRLCFLESVEVENKLYISLPALDIWLHFPDWAWVIDFYNSCATRKTGDAPKKASNHSKDMVDLTETVALASESSLQNKTSFLPDNMNQDSVVLIVRSDNIGLSIYVPVWAIEAAPSQLNKAEVQEERPQNVSSDTIGVRNYKFIVVTTHSSNSELHIFGTTMTFKSILEKTSCTLGMCDDIDNTSRPFFQISQVNLVSEIHDTQKEVVNVNLGVQCDQFDVWLSHQVFCFFYGVCFDIPQAGSLDSSSSSMDFQIQVRKATLLVSDERWSCGGPLLEILMGRFLSHAIVTENGLDCSVGCDLEVNYNNIHKVMWEPFIEPWNFQMNMMRKHEMTALLNSSIVTDFHLTSTAQLNVNFTEPLIECVCRIVEMIKDARGLIGLKYPSQSQRLSRSPITENTFEGRFAPYVLQNLTSLPIVYHVLEGQVNSDKLDALELTDGKYVQPGASVPIHLDETTKEQFFLSRPAQSSDRLNERQLTGVVHHFLSIQIDGTSLPSAPISMDLVGLTCFEVDFSKGVDQSGDVSKYNVSMEENARSNDESAFVVPVVFEVSVQRYSKLIRLYSTVILVNATSRPLELRFDIPFGVSPKILDPIYPGQEFPLPLHLAEAGRMRWRPLGNSFLWSEVHDLSNILSQENKIGFLRSFVCYPSHPSSDPFRCCISVKHFSLPSSNRRFRGSSLHVDNNLQQSTESCYHGCNESKKRLIHQVILMTPLSVNSYLPDVVSLEIESGGVACTVLLSQVETAIHHVDPSHDLGLEFHMDGFRSSSVKFPRSETFSAIAKFSGTKFSLTETMIFNSDFSNGPLSVTVEKTMDAFSGARELFIFVPFLLFNCSGLLLNISESSTEMKGSHLTVASCYEVIEQELLQGKKDGLSLLSSDKEWYTRAPQIDSPRSSLSIKPNTLVSKNAYSQSGRIISKPLVLPGNFKPFHKQTDKQNFVCEKSSLNVCSGSESNLIDSDLVDNEHIKVKARMYSPCTASSVSELMVRISSCLPEPFAKDVPNSLWSGPFLLLPPSGSSTVLIPQSSSSSNAAFIVSVTSSAVAGSFAGRTHAIAFQPRYVISNACRKDLCYRQKGTDYLVHLGVGQHSHLHWTDTTRELLVSLRFNEPGWQWSGSFFPDHLGDTQVKMRNYVSGALSMIRVEVQNADFSIRDEKIVGSLHGSGGTNLILLSEDDTGFIPYRIDNFSKERLRVYQQRCETFDTIVHPYTSCPYAWDEPCYPHRLTVEVPGERVLGLYALDDLKEYAPMHLKSTSEKPERTLLLSIHAEGATKVLCIVDSSYHILRYVKDPSSALFREKSKHEQKPENIVNYKEKFSLAIPCISISLINSYPQELLFACAKDITIDLRQSLDRQKLSFQISSLQIDNQLHPTPYPVILSFNQEYRSNTPSVRAKDDGSTSNSEGVLQIDSGNYCEPVFYLAVTSWKKKDASLISIEYISLRVASFCLELDQELVLSFLDFFKVVSSRFQSKVMPFSNQAHYPLTYDSSTAHDQIYDSVKAIKNQLHGINFHALNGSQMNNSSLPSIVPIGAPWQKIYLLARRQKKVYVELFDLAPIKFTLSFSSAPWILRCGVPTSGDSLVHRGLMALADVEGAQIHLKELTIAHQMASWESMQDILTRHYTRQLLHEMYKVFGSAGVIGNPMGLARNLGLGIRDFLSVPARSILQSPTGLVVGMAQGTASLVSNTVYALSDAATQFSKAAHKGIVAFTFDNQSVASMENQQKGVASHGKGVINEVLEGLTGLLQSPIKGAEKYGLPGVVSGIALGVTGLVARPAASILEVTGKTAQSIRNRSRLYQGGSQRYRLRLPRPLSRELPLKPYSLDEAVGKSVLMQVDNGLKLKDEVLVMCKSLKQSGKFIVVTERLMLIVSCSSLVDLGKPEFRGVPIDLEWFVESEIDLSSVIHADAVEGVVHIIGSSSDSLTRQNQHHHQKSGSTRTKIWNNLSSPMPFFQTNLELASRKDGEELLQVLLSIIEQGKERGWGVRHVLRQSAIM